MENKIDFVIPWVDGSDKKWKKEKEYYDENNISGPSSRFRDWDLLKYWFRGVEKYAPWVNKIYFITCGQKPEWLNENNSKLELINHKDYIPKEYLPIFSSHPIELNLHRIKDLSEQFVYFNDDMYIIDKVKPSDFFCSNLPCDDYCEKPLTFRKEDELFPKILVNNSIVLNRHFDRSSLKNNKISLYFNLKYGLKSNYKTLTMWKYKQFSDFEVSHIPSSFLKSTIAEVWEKEEECLSKVSSHKFRCEFDVNQYLFKEWQYCKGKFVPRSKKFGQSFIINNENKIVGETLSNKKYKVICLNDNHEIKDFDKTKAELIKYFENAFPEKSKYEK